MTLRALIISPAEREAAHAVALFAARPENHYRPYRPGPKAKPPGMLPGHCLQLGVRNDYRCVFSFSVNTDGALYRHLSISVPAPNRLPHPAATEEIARLFGFKGELLPPGGAELSYSRWQLHVSREDNCIVLAQKIE